MKDKINSLLRKYVGYNSWFSWQNLNDLPGPKDRQGLPISGRSWLHLEERVLGFEWNLNSRSCGVDVKFERWGDSEMVIHLALPPVSLFFSTEGILPENFLDKVDQRTIGWAIHHGTLWVYPWKKLHEWSSTDPKWWSFNIDLDPRTHLFGDYEFSSELLKEERVEIPMPEGTYPALIQIKEDTWSRKRASWMQRKMIRAYCEMDEPIPFPGKGTTSYNCGDDGLSSSCFEESNIDKAIGHVVSSVLDYRRRYPL